MLNGEIFRQRLKIANTHVVADTIDYLEAKFFFKTDDWDGLDKWAHFANDSAVYDIRLTEDCIRKEDHLNLSAGMWKVYLHGNEFRDGKVIQRITTDEAVLCVNPTGMLDGEPFPEMPASVTEQILARLDNVEQNGGGGGGIAQETDPTVPAWAKQPKKPSYTADEVGALPASTKIPAKTSDITNDSGFITKAVADLTNYYTKSQTYTQAEVNALVSAIPKFAISVVASLPTTGIGTTTVYLVKSGTSGDLYTEYIYVNGAWEILGNQRVDLTGYATEAWVNTKLSDYLPAAQLTAAINTALAQAKESGEFDGEPGENGITPHIGANGNWYVGEMDTGIPAQGKPGNDYVLTDEDKQEIAGMIPGGGSGGSAGVVIFSVLYTDEQASFLEAPLVYPEGADMDTLLAAGQAQMVMLTPSDSGDGAAKLGVLLPMNVDVGGQTIRFAGTITGKDGNEAVMAELHTGTGEIMVMPVVQNSAGSGSSGGGGVVTITDNGDGTYSSSHTPAEIAAMAETGAVVATLTLDDFPYILQMITGSAETGAAVFSFVILEDDEVNNMFVLVSDYGVEVMSESYYVGQMQGAAADGSGAGGTVPIPGVGNQDAVLHGDGTWRAALSEEDKTDLVHRVIEKLPTWEGGTY